MATPSPPTSTPTRAAPPSTRSRARPWSLARSPTTSRRATRAPPPSATVPARGWSSPTARSFRSGRRMRIPGARGCSAGRRLSNSILTEPGGPQIISSTKGRRPAGRHDQYHEGRRRFGRSPTASQVTFASPIDPSTFNRRRPDSGIRSAPATSRSVYQDPYGATLTGVATPASTVANGTYTSTARPSPARPACRSSTASSRSR